MRRDRMQRQKAKTIITSRTGRGKKAEYLEKNLDALLQMELALMSS